MTDMRRVSIPMPDHIDKRILDLKKKDEYVQCSYAELVRILLNLGLDQLEPTAE